MFVRKTGYAKLRGKAAEIMGLGPPLLACWTHFMTKKTKSTRWFGCAWLNL
jgi:hypothetical protein